MSPEGAANISRGGEGTKEADLVQSYRDRIGVERSAREAWIDDVIDPRETSRLLFRHLKILVARHDEERARLSSPKHGVSPV